MVPKSLRQSLGISINQRMRGRLLASWLAEWPRIFRLSELYLIRVNTKSSGGICAHIEAVSGALQARMESRGARVQPGVFCGSQPDLAVRQAKSISITAE